jgi:transposase
MPKYVSLTAHLSPEELEQRYRKATEPVERSHLQMIWLLAQGKRIREVAEVTGYCANWIRILARRYNQDGPAARAQGPSPARLGLPEARGPLASDPPSSPS